MAHKCLSICLILLTIAWPVGTVGVVVHEHGGGGAHLHTSDVVESDGHHHGHLHEHELDEFIVHIDPRVVADIHQFLPGVTWAIVIELPDGIRIAKSRSAGAYAQSAFHAATKGPVIYASLNHVQPPAPPPDAATRRNSTHHSRRIASLLAMNHAMLL